MLAIRHNGDGLSEVDEVGPNPEARAEVRHSRCYASLQVRRGREVGDDPFLLQVAAEVANLETPVTRLG